VLCKLFDRAWGPLHSKTAKAAEDKVLHLWVLCGRPNRAIRSPYSIKITVFYNRGRTCLLCGTIWIFKAISS
jgi:hypothetical protein